MMIWFFFATSFEVALEEVFEDSQKSNILWHEIAFDFALAPKDDIREAFSISLFSNFPSRLSS